MNHKTEAVEDHNFTAQDKLFLDANIWLYLHDPQKQHCCQADYEPL